MEHWVILQGFEKTQCCGKGSTFPSAPVTVVFTLRYNIMSHDCLGFSSELKWLTTGWQFFCEDFQGTRVSEAGSVIILLVFHFHAQPSFLRKKKKKAFFSKSFTQNRIPFWYLSYGASQVAQVGKEAACNAGDTGETGLIPGLGRCPGGGHGNPLQYSCLEVLMDWGAWWATVPHVTVHNWSDWACTIQKKKNTPPATSSQSLRGTDLAVSIAFICFSIY